MPFTLRDSISTDYASTPHLDFGIVLPPGYQGEEGASSIIIVSIEGIDDHLIKDGKLVTTAPVVTAIVTIDQNAKLEQLYRDTVQLRYVDLVDHEISLTHYSSKGETQFLANRKYYLSNYKGIDHYDASQTEIYKVVLNLREI